MELGQSEWDHLARVSMNRLTKARVPTNRGGMLDLASPEEAKGGFHCPTLAAPNRRIPSAIARLLRGNEVPDLVCDSESSPLRRRGLTSSRSTAKGCRRRIGERRAAIQRGGQR